MSSSQKNKPAGRYTTSHRVVNNIIKVICVINVIKVINVIDVYVNFSKISSHDLPYKPRVSRALVDSPAGQLR